MKALVLSGGKGTRLRPITHTSAKQLVPVANKPVLFYGLEAIAACGIREVGIVVGETAEEIRRAVGDGSRWGLKVTYIPQPEPLGLAHAVKVSRGFLGEDPFVMYLGDNLLRDGIRDLVETFRKNRPDAQVLLARVVHPERFGVAELADGRVRRLEEKPKVPKSDLALVGVYMFTPSIFQAVESIRPSARGEYEITDAIQFLIDRGRRVDPYIVSGWWKDTGKLEDMLEANRLVLDSLPPENRGSVDSASRLEGKVILQEGCRLEQSVIRGPAIIGPGAILRRCYVGPYTSVGPHVLVEDSEVEHSILLEGCRLRGVKRLADSLIGRDVEVTRDEQKPAAYRIMVGDSSRVALP